MSHRVAGGANAAGLSVMANAGGYLLAGCAPFAAGPFHQWWSSWTPALVLLVAATLLQLAVGIPAARIGYVDRRSVIRYV
jgi:MFS transporter, CP family, cyanate transporter